MAEIPLRLVGHPTTEEGVGKLRIEYDGLTIVADRSVKVAAGLVGDAPISEDDRQRLLGFSARLDDGRTAADLQIGQGMITVRTPNPVLGLLRDCGWRVGQPPDRRHEHHGGGTPQPLPHVALPGARPITRRRSPAYWPSGRGQNVTQACV